MEFGGPMSSAGGIYTAIDRIEAIGGDCVQVFTQSPRMWKPTAHTPEAIERFKSRRAEAGIGGGGGSAPLPFHLPASPEGVFREKIATKRPAMAGPPPLRGGARDFPPAAPPPGP